MSEPFRFLDDLRESGIINMLGAVPFLLVGYEGRGFPCPVNPGPVLSPAGA